MREPGPQGLGTQVGTSEKQEAANFTRGQQGVKVMSFVGSNQFDAELVASAQTGDTASVHTLIAEVRPVVLRYCRSRLATYAGGLETADDAAQETCVAVLKALPRYECHGAPFAAFVYAIAANKVADAQRGFRRSAVLVEEVPDQTEPSPTPEELLVTSASFRATNELLLRLPDKTRQVLLMRASGLGADVVGARLGMTANAVRVAQHRGVAKLRQLAEESEEHRELFAGLIRPTADRAPTLKMAVGY